MIQRQFLCGQLALVAYRAAHQYGGHKAMVQVAHCIANRFKQGWGTWEWLFDNLQRYSSTSETLPNMWPHPHDVAWSRLLAEVDGIFEGTSRDPMSTARPNDGPVYWADLNHITNPWFQEEILKQPDKHLRVGNNATLYFWT